MSALCLYVKCNKPFDIPAWGSGLPRKYCSLACKTLLDLERRRSRYSMRPEQREEHTRKGQERRNANPHIRRERDLLKKYNVSLEEFEKKFEEQDRRCAICPADKPGGRWSTWSADHDHSTGKFRGILCHACNTALGLFKDSLELLIEAASYVEKYTDAEKREIL